jgi:hypothetical protein
MPSADRLLVACPECHAWPMAIGPRNELAYWLHAFQVPSLRPSAAFQFDAHGSARELSNDRLADWRRNSIPHPS